MTISRTHLATAAAVLGACATIGAAAAAWTAPLIIAAVAVAVAAAHTLLAMGRHCLRTRAAQGICAVTAIAAAMTSGGPSVVLWLACTWTFASEVATLLAELRTTTEASNAKHTPTPPQPDITSTLRSAAVKLHQRTSYLDAEIIELNRRLDEERVSNDILRRQLARHLTERAGDQR